MVLSWQVFELDPVDSWESASEHRPTCVAVFDMAAAADDIGTAAFEWFMEGPEVYGPRERDHPFAKALRAHKITNRNTAHSDDTYAATLEALRCIARYGFVHWDCTATVGWCSH